MDACCLYYNIFFHITAIFCMNAVFFDMNAILTLFCPLYEVVDKLSKRMKACYYITFFLYLFCFLQLDGRSHRAMGNLFNRAGCHCHYLFGLPKAIVRGSACFLCGYCL